jgi:AcrR family transcriptional regulator
MTRVRLSADVRIFDAADDVFLMYGYHGTSLQQIACKAGVNKSKSTSCITSKATFAA